MQEFDLDPLIAEELLVPSFRSKVERRGDAIYAILHFPILRGNQRPQQEIDFVIGKHFLITTRYETVDPLHAFAKIFEVNAVLGRGSATHGGHLFVSMARSLYLALADESNVLARRLQDIEDRIFKGDERQMVVQISQVGRVIHDFRQALSPHEEMLMSLESATARFFGSEFSYYVHDLQGVYNRMARGLENVRDSLIELRETNNSLLSTKQNEIVKNLTVIAFVFLPLSFIGTLFQMNTRFTPIIGVQGDFWIVLGGMLVVAISCFFYFRYKGWL
jgi:magnesium transporter